MPALKRILIADDNRDAADSLAVVLEFFGHETRVAYNGQEAVELARQFRPDVVILDINMPVMDGYEAAKSLRKAAGSRLVLIAITGVPGRETEEKALDCGFDVHFRKPVDPEELERALGGPKTEPPQ